MNLTKAIINRLALPAAVALISSLSLSASYPAGYYDSLDGKSGSALKSAVKALANGHKQITYGEKGTWPAFKSTDVVNINGTDYWWDMYSNERVVVNGHSGLNIEHSVPQSWFNELAIIRQDIVHLNPSNIEANSQKSNYPLGECSTNKWNNGCTYIGKAKSGQGGDAPYVFEPHDDYKGDFARAYMYIFTTYDDKSWQSKYDYMFTLSNGVAEFRPWATEMLLRWSANDPVSDKERKRNDGVQKEQQNRNPFIDFPELAEYLWGSKAGKVFHLNGSTEPDPVEPDPVYPDPVEPESAIQKVWFAETTSAIEPDWTIKNVTIPNSVSSIWSVRQINGLYYLNASSYVSGTPYASESYIYSPVISLKGYTSAKLSFDHAAKFQTTLKSLCGPVIRVAGQTEWTRLDVATWPSPNTWTFVNSGDIDLSQFCGKDIELGFKYEGNTTGADTWEIRNVKLTANTSTSAIDIYSDREDDSDLIMVLGNNILVPTGARIFDLNGRQVSGENLNPGLYIVAKPSFNHAVKVLIK